MKNMVSKEYVEKVVKIVKILHEWIIRETGGADGIRDEGGLFNSCYKMASFSKKNPENPFLKAAFIYLELAKRHYFVDGNKRTAHVVAKAFLLSDGFHFKAPYRLAVNFIISIAKNDLSIDKIKKWLEDNSIKVEDKDIESYINEIAKDIFSVEYDKG